MTAIQQAALEAISAAVDGKPAGRGCYACVKAGDVVEVGALVREPDQITRDLVAGASAAAEIGTPAARPWQNVYQLSDQLRHLVEKATTPASAEGGN